MPYCISAKDWRNILEKFMEECEQAIANIYCIDCKVHALIYLNQIYSNYLHVQEGESEKPFLIIVDILILELKNSDVFEHVMEILLPMIRRWCKHPSIYKKYNLEGFVYEHIKTTGNYHYCLMDVK